MKKVFLLLLFIPTLGYPQSITNGLIGYWPFNGNANDESGFGNAGVLTGATLTEDRNGNANSAYSFDGADDYIEVQDFSDNFHFSETSTAKPFSISAWVYSNGDSPVRIVYKSLSNDNFNNYEYLFSRNSSLHLGMILRTNESNYISVETENELSNNMWHHVAMTYDGRND